MKALKHITLWLGPDSPMGGPAAAIAAVTLALFTAAMLLAPMAAFMAWWWALFLGKLGAP